ncbi:MAG: NTP transferase domain-containing protein [Methylacidiphilales bacterium]|nr:NTP transferase domain-containing protein [Candidatus Methylacidiphilales bacterium]
MTAPLPTVAILAGGLATRLRPITETIPKALVPVAGRPFLAHQLQLLSRQGFPHAVLCVGHLGEQIEAAFGDGRDHGIHLDYSYDGENLAGTAGALRLALPKLGPSFLTLYGDSYLEIDYRPVCAAFAACGQPALMTVIHETLGSEPANVWFENGAISAYGKKNRTPEMKHIDYGLGLFRAELFHDASNLRDLSDLQDLLAREGRLAGYEVATPYFEIGSPRGLQALEYHLKAKPIMP